jgi:hypothetical protein
MIPKQLRYGSKLEAASSRSYRTNLAPQNGTGTYNLGDTIIINIPTRRNLVLASSECLLKFTISILNQSANNSTYRWDGCGAHGIIQKIVIKHGSNIIENSDFYGMEAKMLYDLQMPLTSVMGKFNILSGTRGDLPFLSPAGNNPRTVQGNTGDRFDPIAAFTPALAAPPVYVSQTYCLSLISLLGTLGIANYLPLFEMTSCPLTMEITLVDNVYKAMAATQVSIANLTNVEYIASFIELSDAAMQMIYSEKGDRPIQYVFPSFRNYPYSTALQNTGTQIQFPISAKFSSLRSLFITLRDQSLGALTYFPYSSVTCGLIDYQFRIGSVVAPSKPPTSYIGGVYAASYCEHYSELLKAIGTIADVGNCGAVDKNSYSLATSVANNDSDIVISNVASGSFYIGIDLEGYCGSDKSSVFAGMDTNTSDIYCIMNFTGRTIGTVKIDAFALIDCVLICENQTAYIRF